eukprot:1040058-Rhodomonas_salina.5
MKHDPVLEKHIGSTHTATRQTTQVATTPTPTACAEQPTHARSGDLTCLVDCVWREEVGLVEQNDRRRFDLAHKQLPNAHRTVRPSCSGWGYLAVVDVLLVDQLFEERGPVADRHDRVEVRDGLETEHEHHASAPSIALLAHRKRATRT